MEKSNLTLESSDVEEWSLETAMQPKRSATRKKRYQVEMGIPLKVNMDLNSLLLAVTPTVTETLVVILSVDALWIVELQMRFKVVLGASEK